MNNAKLYKRSNPLQKRDAQLVMTEFSYLFNDKVNDLTLLDIGCGSGDVLVDIVLPKLPRDFSQVVGVDISKEMIRYASDNYQSEFLTFFRADIESDFLSSEQKATAARGQIKPESFNFITSFYCLHWIQNQRYVILSFNAENIQKPNSLLSCPLDKPSRISTNYSNPKEPACWPFSSLTPSSTFTWSCPR